MGTQLTNYNALCNCGVFLSGSSTWASSPGHCVCRGERIDPRVSNLSSTGRILNVDPSGARMITNAMQALLEQSPHLQTLPGKALGQWLPLTHNQAPTSKHQVLWLHLLQLRTAKVEWPQDGWISWASQRVVGPLILSPRPYPPWGQGEAGTSAAFTSQYSRGQWWSHCSPHPSQSGGAGRVLLGVCTGQLLRRMGLALWY